ncbi:MAG TPA: 50S ribosomal protein L6 [Actinomycetota bacterium]|jgi:large subunit ribosomal protein L6|nr:50S ribosomal protein L6 [Actinomycetota bacterium]
MSRIGKTPVALPSGVEVDVKGRHISVSGPKGRLERALPSEIAIERGDGVLTFTRSNEEREVRALHGLTRSLVANMVQGVTEGYQKTLEIQGVGYRAQKRGNDLELAVGYSHAVTKPAPPGIEFDVPAPTRIVVRGIDKELVGQTAAEIRAIRKPEPYKGKGIRYEGERIRRKGGKAAKG